MTLVPLYTISIGYPVRYPVKLIPPVYSNLNCVNDMPDHRTYPYPTQWRILARSSHLIAIKKYDVTPGYSIRMRTPSSRRYVIDSTPINEKFNHSISAESFCKLILITIITTTRLSHLYFSG